MVRLFLLLVAPAVALVAGTTSGLQHRPESHSPAGIQRPAPYDLPIKTSPYSFTLSPAVLLFSDSETHYSSAKLDPKKSYTVGEADYLGVRELLKNYRTALKSAIDTKDSSGSPTGAGEEDYYPYLLKTRESLLENSHLNPGSENLNSGVLNGGNRDEVPTQHTAISVDVPTTLYGGAESSKRVDESESRKSRLSEILAGQGNNGKRTSLTRFTGIERPRQFLPPSQRTETTTHEPVHETSLPRKPQNPNVRPRKAKKVRFGRKRRPAGRRENGHRQEISQTVTVIKPHTTSLNISPDIEFGRKSVEDTEEAEELPLHVGDKGNVTIYYAPGSASFQKPTLVLRKYSLHAGGQGKSVIVSNSPITHFSRPFPWDVRAGDHIRAKEKGKGKARSIKTDVGSKRKQTAAHAPAKYSDVRSFPDHHGSSLTPQPAGINGRGPPLYFLPLSDESETPSWGGRSYISEPRETRKKEGSLDFDPPLPPSSLSVLKGVDEPLYTPTYELRDPVSTPSTSAYEPLATPLTHTAPITTVATTPITSIPSPVSSARSFSSSTRSTYRPSPSPLPPPPPHRQDVTYNEVTHEAGTGDLARQLAAVTSFTCAGRLPGHHADTETGCKAFHVCQKDGRRDSFLCPKGTLFNQVLVTCDHMYLVPCPVK